MEETRPPANIVDPQKISALSAAGKSTNNDAPTAVSTPRGVGSGQWDRFEVKLSKPSGRQKLGMVLKHAQMVGADKVKRGAYLASLAEGPSLAHDLGLIPKDRLISVEGEDVKTLAFDRIVLLIRKATFPLTLVWSRQRRADSSAKLPGTALTTQRSSRKALDSPRGASSPTSASDSPAPTRASATSLTNGNGLPIVSGQKQTGAVAAEGGGGGGGEAVGDRSAKAGDDNSEFSSSIGTAKRKAWSLSSTNDQSASKTISGEKVRDQEAVKKAAAALPEAADGTGVVVATAGGARSSAATSLEGNGRVAGEQANGDGGDSGAGHNDISKTVEACGSTSGVAMGGSGDRTGNDVATTSTPMVAATATTTTMTATAAGEKVSEMETSGCRSPASVGKGSVQPSLAQREQGTATPMMVVGVGGGGEGGGEGGETAGTNLERSSGNACANDGVSSVSRATSADATEAWTATTQRSRAASRVAREIEAERREHAEVRTAARGTGMVVPRISTTTIEHQVQRAPIGGVMMPMVGKDQQGDPSFRSAGGRSGEAGAAAATAAEFASQAQPYSEAQRSVLTKPQPPTASLGVGEGVGVGTGKYRRLSEAAAEAVAEVLAHQVGVASPSEVVSRSMAWNEPSLTLQLHEQGTGVVLGGEGGHSESGVGGGVASDSWKAREMLAEQERQAQEIRRTRTEEVKRRRRERDKARREERKREEMGLDAGARYLGERRQHALAAAVGRGGGDGGVEGIQMIGSNATINNFNQVLHHNQNQRGGGGSGGGQIGTGGLAGRLSVGGIGGGVGSRQKRSTGRGFKGSKGAGADGGGAGPASSSPEWLTPLMRTTLRDFVGTRYARSRLKQTLSKEWAKQTYRTGIDLGQVDRNVSEAEFIRRRMSGGSLYALLEQEAKDYLRHGPSTDAELEQLGVNFARIASEGGDAADPIAVDGASAVSSPDNNNNNNNNSSNNNNNKSPTKTPASAYRNPTPGTWMDQLRLFQSDTPQVGLVELTDESMSLLASHEHGGVEVGGMRMGAGESGDGSLLGAGPGDGGSAQGAVGGGGEGFSIIGGSGGSNGRDPVWDGQGVDAATVIQHRRRFDQRCTSYEALNNASKVDKTSAFVERTHRLHREHASIIMAKRGTLEGTLENVRSQLSVRENGAASTNGQNGLSGARLRLQDQLRVAQRAVNPHDPTAVAQLADREAAIMTRIAEKNLQMIMIMEEANKVVTWERTADIARREALQYAADVHGHSRAAAAAAALERGALVEAMMSQKATIMLLSTFCKLRGPWLAPTGLVRRGNVPQQPQGDGGGSSTTTSSTQSNGIRNKINSGSKASPSSMDEVVQSSGTASGDPAGFGSRATAMHKGSDAQGGRARLKTGSAAAGRRAGEDKLRSNEGIVLSSPVKDGVAAAAAGAVPDASPPSPAHSMGSSGSGSKGGGEMKKTIKLRLLPPSAKSVGGGGGDRRMKELSSGPLSPPSPMNVTSGRFGEGGREENRDRTDDRSGEGKGTSPRERSASVSGSTSGTTRPFVKDRNRGSETGLPAAISPKAGARARGEKETVMARLAEERAAVDSGSKLVTTNGATTRKTRTRLLSGTRSSKGAPMDAGNRAEGRDGDGDEIVTFGGTRPTSAGDVADSGAKVFGLEGPGEDLELNDGSR